MIVSIPKIEIEQLAKQGRRRAGPKGKMSAAQRSQPASHKVERYHPQEIYTYNPVIPLSRGNVALG